MRRVLRVGFWRCGRVVDGGSLENCCAATHRGFESLRLRAIRIEYQSFTGLLILFFYARGRAFWSPITMPNEAFII